jgi:hypothetical protein
MEYLIFPECADCKLLETGDCTLGINCCSNPDVDKRLNPNKGIIMTFYSEEYINELKNKNSHLVEENDLQRASIQNLSRRIIELEKELVR